MLIKNVKNEKVNAKIVIAILNIQIEHTGATVDLLIFKS